MAEAPLDALCSICYTSPPKYRCPRCPTVRTCSLPCYKRHQQRATCTGQRNESTFVKKSQLSTAAGLDHDYNFLTKIERAFRTADADADADRPAKRRKVASHPAFVSYLAENRITVQHAPPGLHRAKTNQSRFLPRSKKVAWTVEWIDDARVKRTTEVLDDTRLSDAYASMAGRAAKQEKRCSQDDGVKPSATPSVLKAEPTKKADTTIEHADSARSAAPLHSRATVEPAEPAESAEPTGLAEPAKQAEPASPPETITAEGLAIAAPQIKQDETSPPGTSLPNGMHLYLHRPRTLSSLPVLIPLSPTSTLTAVLHRQTLDEYPTLYHLPYAASCLPPDHFVTNTAYEARLKSDLAGLEREDIVRSVDTVLQGKTVWMKREEEAGDEEEKKWDEKRVLDMLKRDVAILQR
ncbi:hypothetical protein K461DRAFT_57636 [Myriangium duriaei CBS 260.36]|uniref:HIT-type domain-containing protein n=1 Tax=Myriangium duriaei CBS 260.36 TaxID=1168546 RepID=A0A9P4IYK9_9PEZI|nr:hypothetical protein K461DRAFT_57636 [Myriangium duriaei CBS 260.36]